MATLPTTLAEERRRRIATMTHSGGGVRVIELRRQFGVSDMTIRRDLAVLEADGLIDRVHGGAVKRGVATHARTPFGARQVESAAAKRWIARAVADLVTDGETILLDIGTTCFYVACELRRRRGLVVLTNSINAALELASDGGHETILLGGQVHGRSEHSLVGPAAIESVRQYRVDKLILGAGGVTLDRGFVYFDLPEVEVRRAMLEVTREVIVAADHTKFGADSLVALAPLDCADVIVTDREPDARFADELRRRAVRVQMAEE